MHGSELLESRARNMHAASPALQVFVGLPLGCFSILREACLSVFKKLEIESIMADMVDTNTCYLQLLPKPQTLNPKLSNPKS